MLVPDTAGAAATQLARRLEDAGHRVHRCMADGAGGACVGLTDGRCPLDTAAVDVAVSAAGAPADGNPADGATCAARRRLPLVLVGADTSHPLAPWATAMPGAEGTASAVDHVLARPLGRHTDEAERAMLHELRRQGSSSDDAVVAVYRRPGRLLVDLTYRGAVSPTQAQRLAAHVAQAVRGYDRWAPKLDVAVHEDTAALSV
ncbi:MAG: hypothetical protein KGJ77_02615 [Acidobacteriota bacterium]|nr:hypothetical protein [Acidobacteriota bacterium]